MPILEKELKVNQETNVKSFLVENVYNGLVMEELNNSLKRIESVLIDLFRDIDTLDLNYYDISKDWGVDVGKEGEFERVKMKIVQGQNRNLVDNIKLMLSVLLRMFSEVDSVKDKVKVLINDNIKLKEENTELSKTLNKLNSDISRLLCEKYHVEENLKEKTMNCNMYKNSLNSSIKAMKKLYWEKDCMNKEIGILENQLVISKLRVAQHNEELEHIRILLKYYKNQVSQECLLSPAIEQMVKVEPCRVSFKCEDKCSGSKGSISNNKKGGELGGVKDNTTTGIKTQTNIGSILSKLLFNGGLNTNTSVSCKENIGLNAENRMETKSTSPLYKYSPLKNNYFYSEPDETLLSKSAYNIDLSKESCNDESNSLQLYEDDDAESVFATQITRGCDMR
ncbi:hypothetical protein FG386_003437 [Cryptosporidium ryanae]|uniref:uncharacterized protein n=1 Tax=Cryptosporidium ryanae TaxID=515981 RepID=UPI00351AB083|nr:hypothetical protein FG386_003437 [Cryptosporidium ryanae]